MIIHSLASHSHGPANPIWPCAMLLHIIYFSAIINGHALSKKKTAREGGSACIYPAPFSSLFHRLFYIFFSDHFIFYLVFVVCLWDRHTFDSGRCNYYRYYTLRRSGGVVNYKKSLSVWWWDAGSAYEIVGNIMQYQLGGGDSYSYEDMSGGRRTSLELAGQSASRLVSPLERVERLASENAVVVFSMSSCCMCHVVKRLFCSLGVNPTVYELDEEHGGKEMERVLSRLVGEAQAVPAVFVGGKLVGGLERVMSSHINGTLVPLLKDAGALWL